MPERLRRGGQGAIRSDEAMGGQMTLCVYVLSVEAGRPRFSAGTNNAASGCSTSHGPPTQLHGVPMRSADTCPPPSIPQHTRSLPFSISLKSTELKLPFTLPCTRTHLLNTHDTIEAQNGHSPPRHCCRSGRGVTETSRQRLFCVSVELCVPVVCRTLMR